MRKGTNTMSSTRAMGCTLAVGIYLRPFFVCARNEGSDEAVHVHRLV